MRINNNLMAMNTHRMKGQQTVLNSKSMEKLSSGYRINRAGDDAAGLAISEKMRAQIRGLQRASRNSQDAISLIQTAEGGAASIHEMLQRIRELAVQSANDTLVNEDRDKIQSEVDQIMGQIDTVANNTEFNTKKILNNDGTTIDSAVTDALTAKIPTMLNDALNILTASYGIALPTATTNMTVQYYDDASDGAGASMGTSDGISLTLRVNLANVTDGSGNLIADDQLDRLLAHEMMHGLQFTEMSTFLTAGMSNDETWVAEGLAMLIQGGNLFAAGSLTNNSDATIDDAWSGGISDYAEAYLAMRTLHEITNGGIAAFIDRLEAGDTLDQAMNATTQNALGEVDPSAAVGGPDFTTFQQFIDFFDGSGAVDTYLDTQDEFATTGTGAINTNASTQGSDDNPTIAATIPNLGVTTLLDSKYTLDFSGATSELSGSTQFHIGANEGQDITFQNKNLKVSALELTGLELTSQELAANSITRIDKAIEKVSNARSYFGAMQNRLEHTIANLDNTHENLQAAESRIRDVDMADEMMRFTTTNILMQAAQSMLAQANQSPEGVLQLLR